MPYNIKPIKAYACFNRHGSKIFGCWVQEFFPHGGVTETNFDGDVKACMEYWTGLHGKQEYRCFVKIFDI